MTERSIGAKEGALSSAKRGSRNACESVSGESPRGASGQTVVAPRE